MVYPTQMARAMATLLEEAGVKKGSVWRYFRQPDDDPATAIIDVKNVISDELKLVVYILEPGPWGNKTPEMLRLEKLEAGEFLQMISSRRLRAV